MSLITTKVKEKVKPIVRRGLIFRSGAYPDKGITVSPSMLRSAAAAFTPCPVNLEHAPSVLDGSLGTLKSVSVNDAGTELYGEYEEPTWLSEVLGSIKREVSIEWNFAKKTICGMALVLSPRITDAALFAAFSDVQQGKPVARLADNEAIDWNAVDSALAQSGYPPAKRPGAAFSGGPDDINWQQVEAACASFTAWKPGR